MYAVETTDRMQLCQINARNIKLYRNYNEAKIASYQIALSHRDCMRAKYADIQFDNFLDVTQKVFNASEGNNKEAPALAWITKIQTEK